MLEFLHQPDSPSFQVSEIHPMILGLQRKNEPQLAHELPSCYWSSPSSQKVSMEGPFQSHSGHAQFPGHLPLAVPPSGEGLLDWSVTESCGSALRASTMVGATAQVLSQKRVSEHIRKLDHPVAWPCHHPLH